MTGVLCVGTPRLHEVVQSQLAPSVRSLLLDVDDRYVSWGSFCASSSLFVYNVCTCRHSFTLRPCTSATICSMVTFMGRGERGVVGNS